MSRGRKSVKIFCCYDNNDRCSIMQYGSTHAWQELAEGVSEDVSRQPLYAKQARSDSSKACPTASFSLRLPLIRGCMLHWMMMVIIIRDYHHHLVDPKGPLFPSPRIPTQMTQPQQQPHATERARTRRIACVCACTAP